MKSPRILATAIALLTAVPFHVSAQYWDAEDYLNNSNVGNPLNWQGDIAPVNDGTASLFFNSVGIANSSTPNFAVAWSVNHLQVDTNYTLTGQAVTIGAGGLNLFGLGSVFFDNRINFTADQSFDLAAQTAHFRGGLDINATTLTLDSVNGGDFHTTGLYGTGTINQTGGTWHHKSGGVTFHADVTVDDFANFVIEGAGTHEFASGSDINVINGNLSIEADSVFKGGSVKVRSGFGIGFGSGTSVTLQNGTQMTVGTVGVFSSSLSLSGADLTVTGTGSSLLHIGDSIAIGNGSLSVLAGASASSLDDIFGPSGINVGGGGTLLVDGTGSTLTSSGGNTNEWGDSTGTATVTISNNAVATLTQVDVASLGTAINALGNVTVSSGADVTSSVLRVGTLGTTGSAGTVIVTGTGTTWTLSSTGYIGSTSGASGVLRVEDNATFSTSVFGFEVRAKGSIAINGGILNANGDSLLDGSGALLTKTAGSQFNLAAGKTLTVKNGGDVIFQGLYNTAGGHITVTGGGSTFASDGGNFNITAGSVFTVTSFGTVNTPSASITNVNTLASVVIAGGTFLANGDMTLDGAGTTLTRDAAGSFTLATGKTLTVSQGADAIFTGNYVLPGANITVSGSGSTWTQTGSGALTIGSAFGNTATVTVQNGGAFSTGTGAVDLSATGTVNVAGGTFTVNGPLTSTGAISLTAGTLNLGTNGLSIGGSSGFLGGNVTLAGGQTLLVGGTTTVQSGKSLLLSGATFRTGALVNSGTFTFTSGLLGITGAGGLNINGSGPLGGTFTLGAGSTLEVTNTTTVGAGGSFTMTGGSFTSGSLANSGDITLTSGSIALGAPLTNNAGARLFVPASVPVPVAITNAGQIVLQNGISNLGGAGGITNTGLIKGDGAIAKAVTNSTGGELRAESGKTLTFNGANGTNIGLVNMTGGAVVFAQQLTNAAAGQITGFGTLTVPTSAQPNAGLVNQGVINLSGGSTALHGSLNLSTGSQLIVGSGNTATFFDSVRHNGTELRTNNGATAIFSGAVTGAGPFTGNGAVQFNGSYAPGNSAALVNFGGDVAYGAVFTNHMELGGTTRGTQYDALNVAGKLTFGGTLNVTLISGFQPVLGNVFNLYDFGTTAGTFSTVTLPALPSGLLWSQANLYTAGELKFVLDPVVISRTWDGGGANNNWITDANWTSDVQPLNNATADLNFAGATRLAPSVESAWNVRSIKFTNTAGAFTITGPQGVTIGNGGIVNNDTDTQTIAAAITLSASESFNAAAGDLAITSVALAGQTLAITGANDVTLASASGTGTINKNNAGRLDITGILGTGGVTLNAVTGPTNIGASETLAALNIGNGATVTLGAIAPAPEFGMMSAQPVPEPGTGALLLSALALFARRSRRQGAATFLSPTDPTREAPNFPLRVRN